MTRVALVCPIVVRHDAISAAARHSYLALASDERFEPTVLTWLNEFDDVRSEHAGDLGQLLVHPRFLAADVVLYHFGVYATLFDAMLVGNGHAPQAVKFHNVTPMELVPAHDRATAEASLRQIHNLRNVDEVWSDSETNALELRRRGFDPARLVTVPLAVETPAIGNLRDKRPSPIEICFVGRIVESKGVLDLVQALRRMRTADRTPIHVRIAGNQRFSDPSYIARVQAEIRESGLAIEMLGTVDDDRLEDLYRTSHIFAIPSYHEGFSKPAVEAMRAGCVTVGYAAHNLPNIVGSLGRLVGTGDIDALAGALGDAVEGVARGFARPAERTLALDGGTMSIDEFDTAAKDRVAAFTFDAYARTIRSRTAALARGAFASA